MSDAPERRKPTIAELEAILEGPDQIITINPDGSISASEAPKIRTLEEILDDLPRKGGGY